MVKDFQRPIRLALFGNAAVLAGIAFCLFLYPVGKVLLELTDLNIRQSGIPKSAWTLHRELSPKYQRWAEARLNSERAAELSTHNISGTEWPLFGSVFYLWSTESLQDEWDRNPTNKGIAPRVYARGAIEAATQLVIDPKQANWVKIHWGTNYLRTENVFYRMLVISALTSHARLTGEKGHLPMLKEQAESLLQELDASKYGILDDYPGECYPGDVLTALAMIHRADKVLGTDHSQMLDRSLRGFHDERLDTRGLVPYSALSAAGVPDSPSRGCGNSYVSLFSPELWPEQGRIWYELYTKYFWQEKWFCAGFREFPNDMPGHEWYMDVDAGPVLKGYGCAACAFGVGAARINGHFEQAYPLTTEMLATSWPLPGGTRLIPRLLSNAADAPFLGEAGILFNLTRLPAPGVSVKTGGSVPGFVWLFLSIPTLLGTLLMLSAISVVKRTRKIDFTVPVAAPLLRLGLWVGLLLAGLTCLAAGKFWLTLLFLMLSQLLPMRLPQWRKIKATQFRDVGSNGRAEF